ncbi:hypothetical protein ACROYT_G030472 [Oculina patagonica]
MAEKREKGVVRDEITKLRLRLLEQKIRSQSRGNNTGLEVYDSSLASSSSGFQQFLQAETVKSNHLLQRVKVCVRVLLFFQLMGYMDIFSQQESGKPK